MHRVDRLTAPPAPIGMAEARAHLRVDAYDDAPWVASLIQAAAREFEEAAGVALVATTIRATFDPPPLGSRIALPVGPVLPGAVATATLDGEAFSDFELVTGARPFLRLHDDDALFGALVVTYPAGFGTVRAAIPAEIVAAILDQVAASYYARGAADARTLALAGRSPAFARIVARYRGVAL
jgi:uncharacterized phiE125 gp8 family phage protein